MCLLNNETTSRVWNNLKHTTMKNGCIINLNFKLLFLADISGRQTGLSCLSYDRKLKGKARFVDSRNTGTAWFMDQLGQQERNRRKSVIRSW